MAAQKELHAAASAASLAQLASLPKILDLRTTEEYTERRLVASINIPLAQILRFCFLLPTPSVQFAVLAPRPDSYRLVPERSQADPSVNAVWLRGHSTIASWLRERWTAAEVWTDEPELWRAAAELGITETGRVPPTALATRGLFSPSPVLASAISEIEAAISRRRQAAPLPGCCLADCLDIGCGSGRDMLWLAARGWRVTGCDAWAGALERAHDLSAAMQLPAGQVRLVFGTISSDTGELQLQQLPAKSCLHSATHARVLAAAEPADTPAAAPLQQRQFDLIVCVRFLERALLPRLPGLLRPGGFLIISTFVDGPGTRRFGRPCGFDNVLSPGELRAKHFGPEQGFVVVKDSVVLTDDGRELSDFVAQLIPDKAT